MAGSGKTPGMIDGFTSVQAVRHKRERSTERKSSEGKAPPAVAEESRHRSVPAEKKKVSIGHTALPTRHELVCYSCRYNFVVNGRLDKVFCPKCREQLETDDHSIEGDWRKDILTVGTVHIKSGSKVIGANIIATDIIIGGDCSEANLKPTRHIEMETGAVVSPGVLNNHKVIIRAGAQLSLDAPLRCADLEIHGEIQAKALPTGKVTVYAGGMFRGELEAAHLIVHEGGGLSANLRIRPAEETAQSVVEKTKPPPGKTEQKTKTPAKPVSKPVSAQPELPLQKSVRTVAGRKSSKKRDKRAFKQSPDKVR
jgi:cytoskeletal protein CcmA (bactofilin family)